MISTLATPIPDWDPNKKNNGGFIQEPKGQMTADGKTLLVLFGKQLFEFETENGKQTGHLELEQPVEEFELSPDGQWLVTVHRLPDTPQAITPPIAQFRLVIQERQSLKVRYETIVHGNLVYGLAFSNNSQSLAYNTDGKVIDVIEVPSGKPKAQITGIPVFHHLRFSNNGRRLAATQYNETILLWDLEKFAEGAGAQAKQQN